MLWFFAYVVIPVSTVLFAQDSNWFTMNFSILGNQEGWEDKFTLWGLMIGIYFYCCMRQILVKTPHKSSIFPYVILALILHVLALTTPYLPKELPFQASLHVIFSFSSAVVLMLCLLAILIFLYPANPAAYQPYVAALIGIALVSLCLLAIAGMISSAMEIFFIITTGILMYQLQKRLSFPASSSEAL